MLVGCRKCRELLSITAIKRNIYFIDALLIGAHTQDFYALDHFSKSINRYGGTLCATIHGVIHFCMK
jgi:hypothetical protein